jgi:hypothetical protein
MSSEIRDYLLRAIPEESIGQLSIVKRDVLLVMVTHGFSCRTSKWWHRRRWKAKELKLRG